MKSLFANDLAVKVINVSVEPSSALSFHGDQAVVVSIAIEVITVSKFALEQLNSKNSEHHQEQQDNKQYVQEGRDGQDQGVYHSLDTCINKIKIRVNN